jgi:hypothetical protein
MGSQGLLKAFSFERGLAVVCPDHSGIVEHAVDAGWANRNNIGVKHHEGEPAVALRRMSGMEVEDGSFLPVLQPSIARNQCAVLVA